MKRTLTESQMQTLRHALAVASERFEDDARTMQESGASLGAVNARRLSDQFKLQTKETRALLTLIDDADQITLLGGA